MCSIGGWISRDPLSVDQALLLTQALVYYGSPRGQQAAGVWVPDHVCKRAMHPDKFIGIRAFTDLFDRPVNMALTHTRMPTCGGQGDSQAQPFRRGQVITVHNGMLGNYKELKKQFALDKSSGVDSELFTDYIHANGLQNLSAFTKEVSGSYAVGTVVNGEMYAFRDSNPFEWLRISLNDGNSLVAWASTEEQLMRAVRSVWLMPPHVRTITLGSGGLYRIQPDGVTRVSDIESKWKQTTYNAQHSGYNRDEFDGWDNSWWDRRGNRKPDKSTPPSRSSCTTTTYKQDGTQTRSTWKGGKKVTWTKEPGGDWVTDEDRTPPTPFTRGGRQFVYLIDTGMYMDMQSKQLFTRTEFQSMPFGD